MLEKGLIALVMDSAVRRTQTYFQEECGISVVQTEHTIGELDVLELRDLTAIVGVGGPVNLLIAFTFERRLIEALYERLTADIEIPPGEEDLYRESAAGEIVNTVIGNCTADFQQKDTSITLSPPVILDRARRILRSKEAVFLSRHLHTEFGHVDICFVGPPELFDSYLNYVGDQ